MAPKFGAPGAACPRGWRRPPPLGLEPRRTNGHSDHPTQPPCHRATEVANNRGGMRACVPLFLPPRPHRHPTPTPGAHRVASLPVGGGGAEDHRRRRRIGVQDCSPDPVPPNPVAAAARSDRLTTHRPAGASYSCNGLALIPYASPAVSILVVLMISHWGSRVGDHAVFSVHNLLEIAVLMVCYGLIIGSWLISLF
jgi:hypothetical protein